MTSTFTKQQIHEIYIRKLNEFLTAKYNQPAKGFMAELLCEEWGVKTENQLAEKLYKEGVVCLQKM